MCQQMGATTTRAVGLVGDRSVTLPLPIGSQPTVHNRPRAEECCALQHHERTVLSSDRSTVLGHYPDVNASLRSSLVLGLSLLVAGCSLPSVEVSVEGPTFTLTADEPVAAFEVTLCLEGPSPRMVHVNGTLNADARTTAGTATLELDSLADRPGDDEPDRVETSEHGAELAWFSLAADGDWEGSGRRCSVPEIVEFSAHGLASDEALEVEAWAVTLGVQWDDGMFGDGPDEGDLSVEIERL